MGSAFPLKSSLVILTFSVTFQKIFLSHLTNTSQILYRKSPAGIVEYSFEYWLQISLTNVVGDFTCLGIF